MNEYWTYCKVSKYIVRYSNDQINVFFNKKWIVWHLSPDMAKYIKHKDKLTHEEFVLEMI
jgi:hypothetical protein